MEGRERHGFTWRWCKNNLFSSFLYLAALITYSHAQNTLDSVSAVPTSNSVKVSGGMSTTALTSTTGSILSTMIVSSLSSPTTSHTSGPTDLAPTDLFPATTSAREGETHNEAVFNYYFLFLVLFGVLVAALLWWLQRQKKRRKERMRLGGQHALARDMEGWASTRRFMHGRYGRYHHSAPARHEEGLDEHGEAPPPYQPKSDHADAGVRVGAAPGVLNTVAIPLRTLARDGLDRSRPPGYRDALSGTPVASTRPYYP